MEELFSSVVDGLRNWQCIWAAGFFEFFNRLFAALAPPRPPPLLAVAPI
jgi:hypothetical protein